jgi:CRISPR-associated protein (TIGR02584 family)
MTKRQQILLAVTGLSPQVVTETVYALFKANKPIPTKIIIISTQIGANEAKKHLLEHGKLQQLCTDYNLPNIELKEEDICIIPDENGEILNDINAQKQMNILADFICNKVQQLTLSNDIAVHASLAGGRKTMTFFLGMAMSLYGRKQDKLSHVLVTTGYESSDFFYPTPYSFNVTNYQGSILDARYAKVVLTEIPFVRLRDNSPDKLVNGSASYSETVEWLNYDSENEKLILNSNSRVIDYCNKQCKLPPADFAFYQWFCQRIMQGKNGLIIPYECEPNKIYAEEFINFYQQHVDESQIDELQSSFQRNASYGMSKAYFEEKKSRVNNSLNKAFGKPLGKNITINRTTKQGDKYQFAITLAAELIHGED